MAEWAFLPVHLVPVKYIGKLILEPFLNLVGDHYCRLIELAALRLTTGVMNKTKQTRLPHSRPRLSTEQKESESRRNQNATFFLQKALPEKTPIECIRTDGIRDLCSLTVRFQSVIREVPKFCRRQPVFQGRKSDFPRFLFNLSGPFRCLLEELFVLLLDDLLKVTVKHVYSYALAYQVPDALARNGRVRILNSDPNFPDARQEDVLRARQFRMLPRALRAGLQRRE